MAEKTMSDFAEMFNQDDACYIYYVDKKLRMHFLSDANSVNLDASDLHALHDTIYTDNLSDAVLCTYEQAKTLKFLCDYLFDFHVHHIVRIRSSVEWL